MLPSVYAILRELISFARRAPTEGRPYNYFLKNSAALTIVVLQ